jgi:hypothetical protein
VLEGNAPSASEWSTALGVEFWAQHPPHTNPARIHPSRGLVRGLYGAEIFGIHIRFNATVNGIKTKDFVMIFMLGAPPFWCQPTHNNKAHKGLVL